MSSVEAVKEQPILFSGPMVRAILEGRKAQTRRIVKVPSWGQGDVELCDKDGQGQSAVDWPNVACKRTGCLAEIPCPYGVPGDRLWVRETHFIESDGKSVVYRADGEFLEDWTKRGLRWQPSIFMPRWASRITLNVTGVRVERLQEISELDARSEGFGLGAIVKAERFGRYMTAGQYTFANLWEQINGRGSWTSNPLVWVVEFSRVANRV